MPTLDDLKKIIGEEVKKAVRTELRDLILEAVEIASRPEQQQPDSETRLSRVEEIKEPAVKPVRQPPTARTGNTIQDVLAETAASMTSEDYENIYGTSTKESLAESYASLGENTLVDSPAPSVGVELNELPSFIKNAKAILDASYSKDKERHAV